MEPRSLFMRVSSGSQRTACGDEYHQGRVTARQPGETKITARYGAIVSPVWILAVRAEKTQLNSYHADGASSHAESRGNQIGVTDGFCK